MATCMNITMKEGDKMASHAAATVFITAGGTGGHVFPGIALAHQLQARGIRVIFLTDARTKNYLEKEEIEHYLICSASPSVPWWKKPLAAMKLLFGFAQSRAYILKEKPIAVIGFGGYSSFPTMMAACHCKCRTLIHEQNTVLGKVNRFFATKVDHVALSYPQTQYLPEGVPHTVVGTPVRHIISTIGKTPPKRPTEPFSLLVTGGSQGARIFGTLLPDALSLLFQNTKYKIQIAHQCHKDYIPALQVRYQELGIEAEISPFFHHFPELLSQADLVIGRAGASTLAEVTVAGRASILIPYPYSTDQHQLKNARYLEEKGATICIEQAQLTAQSLADALDSLLSKPEYLHEKAKHAHGLCSATQSTAALADLILARHPL